jgi:membrane-bound inhibitor of C-type lysozyme
MRFGSGCALAACIVPLLAAPHAFAADPKATFVCDGGRTIVASFPEGKAELAFGDGKTISLPQAMSGSGARYANADDTFEFWNKGNTAFAGPPGKPEFTGCIVVSDTPETVSWLAFASSKLGFSIRYPEGWAVNADFTYEGLGPDKPIAGASFTISAALAKGTNLSPDSYLSVETLPDVADCTAAAFLPEGADAPKSVDENGTIWSVATMQDAGAGNFYDETVHAMPGTAPCRAVRYLIHSTNIANYDPGTVKEFDRAALTATFDTMRRSLVIGQ